MKDSIYILICQCMVHGEADDLLGHLSSDWQILLRGRRKATVGGEITNEGVEITATQDAMLTHLEVQLITGHTIFLMDENGEVAVVMPDTRQVIPEFDALNIS